jgi:hypothetical protein
MYDMLTVKNALIRVCVRCHDIHHLQACHVSACVSDVRCTVNLKRLSNGAIDTVPAVQYASSSLWTRSNEQEHLSAKTIKMGYTLMAASLNVVPRMSCRRSGRRTVTGWAGVIC